MPSLSVSLSAEELAEVQKAARREKKTPNRVIAEIVRVWTESEGA